MTNAFTHFYLYAKGHYHKTDLIEDLKKIAGNYTGCSPESESIGAIMNILSDAITELLGNDPNGLKRFNYAFMNNVAEFKNFKQTPRLSYESYILTCLQLMAHCKIEDIKGEIGRADHSILPPSKWT